MKLCIHSILVAASLAAEDPCFYCPTPSIFSASDSALCERLPLRNDGQVTLFRRSEANGKCNILIAGCTYYDFVMEDGSCSQYWLQLNFLTCENGKFRFPGVSAGISKIRCSY